MSAEPELRLRCLELAMAQARAEVKHGDIDRVVDISTRFYNHIIQEGGEVGSTHTEPEQPPSTKGKKKTDKASPIFD